MKPFCAIISSLALTIAALPAAAKPVLIPIDDPDLGQLRVPQKFIELTTPPPLEVLLLHPRPPRPLMPDCRFPDVPLFFFPGWTQEEFAFYSVLPICPEYYRLQREQSRLRPLAGHLSYWYYKSSFTKEPKLKGVEFRIHKDNLKVDLPVSFFKDRDEFTFILRKPYSGFAERHTLRKQDGKPQYPGSTDRLTIDIKSSLNTIVFSLSVPELNVEMSGRFGGVSICPVGAKPGAVLTPW